MADLGLHVCAECGAAIPFAQDGQRPSEPERLHAEWHDKLRQVLDQKADDLFACLGTPEKRVRL